MNVMLAPTPPESFLKRMAEIDPCLVLRWGKSTQFWSIWYHNPYSGEMDHVLNVVNDDGSFRPLDDRTLMTLRANRFYANNPKLLEKKMCDDLLEEIAQKQKKVRNALQELSKDKALKRRWNAWVEKIRRMDWNEWHKPVYAKNKRGEILYREEGGKPVLDRNGNRIPIYIYKPDPNLPKKKPTGEIKNEITESNA